ncbi:MAG TPA: hypothetical protein VEC18_03395 [Myxococcota bacterium]|nr:hypothetical protein [Myxococcota bacterium]
MRWLALAAASACVACASPGGGARTAKIDQVSRSAEAFTAFLGSRGRAIEQIRAAMPRAPAESVYLVAPEVPNAELARYIELDASGYAFEIFLRVLVSKRDRRVHRYLVKGDWRSVKLGFTSLRDPEWYDAVYLHTHPRDKRLIPNSIPDFLHAEVFPNVSKLVVGDGIPVEFESIARNADGIDVFEIDGRQLSIERPTHAPPRTKDELRRAQHDVDDAARELDRIFRESVERGSQRVELRNADGMRVVYDRRRPLAARLDDVYRLAELALPEERAGSAPARASSRTPESGASPALGY